MHSRLGYNTIFIIALYIGIALLTGSCFQQRVSRAFKQILQEILWQSGSGS